MAALPMHLDPDRICTELNERLRALGERRPLHVAFVPSGELERWRYLPADFAADLATVSNERVKLSTGPGWEQADVLLTTAHGRNNSEVLHRLRTANPAAVLAVWLWDNHLAFHRNLATTCGADLYFVSHAYCAAQVASPVAALAGHVPACCAQWTAGMLRTALAQAETPRSGKVYAGYVDYPFSARHGLLTALRTHAPEFEVQLMRPDDRSRYFDQSPAERLAEWLRHPASVVLPVDRDLSTRFFDALAAGQIPLVSDGVADLDAVVPPSEQASLPVFKFKAGDLADLRRAAAAALAHFAREGAGGVRRRQLFAGGKHLLAHRLLRMVRVVLLAAEGKLRAGSTHSPEDGISLRLAP